MRKVKLPYGVTVFIDGSAGSVISDLRVLEFSETERIHNAKVEAVEQVVLSLGISGIDIESESFSNAFRMAIDGLGIT